MKNFIINKCMNYIKNNSKCSDAKLIEIKYGLAGIYLTMTKIIFILIISTCLGMLKEILIFMLLFNILRTAAFGLHATKSWICWICSTLVFILIPYLCIYLNMNIYIMQIICLINTLLMFKNSPADTKKRPIVSRKRRNVFKAISTLLVIIYSILAILIKNNFISNCLVFSMIVENVLISPITYKLFKMPYNNYINFLKNHPDFVN